jgi:hypothetical protein
MATILKWFNDNHWYLIAGLIISGMFFWTYGCESKVESLMTAQKKINRAELSTELQYMVSLAKAREEDLDRQDAAKQALLDAATVIGSTGSINPAGLVNIAATIAAVGWGLKKNQQVNTLTKTTAV